VKELKTGRERAHILVDGKGQTVKSIADMVSEVFIWGVGITRPKPGRERTAALFITFTLVGTLVAVVLAFLLLVRVL
jgi:hypothetical protein